MSEGAVVEVVSESSGKDQFGKTLTYRNGEPRKRRLVWICVGIIVVVLVPAFVSGPPSEETVVSSTEVFSIPMISAAESRVDLPKYSRAEDLRADEQAKKSVPAGTGKPIKLAGPQLLKRPRAVKIPPGAMVKAKLTSGASNGLVKAEIKEALVINGETLIEAGTIAVGNGNSSDSRLFIKFNRLVYRDGTADTVQGEAADDSDKTVGLKGSKIGHHAIRLAAGIGLNFAGGVAEGRNPYLYWPYFFTLAGSGFLVWAGLQTGVRRRLVKQLTEAFNCAGLKSRMGKVPGFIFDRPLDAYTRKLKVTNAKLPLSEFRKAKETIESGLGIYVDDIKEERSRGTIEITYSHFPMPDICKVESPARIGGLRFVVGHTRARQLKSEFNKIPHLLIAGQTNSGKSTFLRQLITTTYLNNSDLDFTLIDLKEGLEFQLFENLERVSVVSDLTQASGKLTKFEDMLKKRMALLKTHQCKDIAAYLALPKAAKSEKAGDVKSIKLNRHLIIIDEAADIFLAGSHAASADIQKARRVLVEIARKGRAVGLHLVFATQRPDSRSIDAQIKANLPGIICFQMPNDASSMIVLGNGRATDLPPIPGRAIWKAGSEMIEVQTPLMTPEEADELLQPYRKQTPANKDASPAQSEVSAPQAEASAETQASSVIGDQWS